MGASPQKQYGCESKCKAYMEKTENKDGIYSHRRINLTVQEGSGGLPEFRCYDQGIMKRLKYNQGYTKV